MTFMNLIHVSLGVSLAALIVAAILMVSKRASRKPKLGRGQEIIPPEVEASSGKSEPRTLGGFRQGDKVTFLEPTVGRMRGWIIRFKGFKRSFVLCTDGLLRRVKISRLAAA